MKRNLWNAVHRCTKCSSTMDKKNLILDGINVRGWECAKCKETVLHQEDAQKIFLINKLKKGLPVKIGELGNNLVVRIPKEIASFYKLSKGEQITMRAEGDKKIELEMPV